MPSITHQEQPHSSDQQNRPPVFKDTKQPIQFPPRSKPKKTNTAIVYCEGNFGAIDGKTANGLVRHSEKYKILSVIDSELAGLDSGEVLGDAPNAIPICRDLADALANAENLPVVAV